MYMYEFIQNMNKENQINLEDITNIEQKYDVIFPKELVEFLIHQNGSEIYLSQIIGKDVVKYEISSLIPIKYGLMSMEKMMEWDRMDGFVKPSTIPIANDRGGNVYYLDVESGEILLYFGEDIENPKVICLNFDEMLRNIHRIV